MGLNQGDAMAVVALVVSLIALCNGFIQAAQQLLGTAHGYRNCKESIIGPWSATRHRKWIWREFRYEVLYQTPEIMLLADDELRTKGRICPLSRVQDDPGSYTYFTLFGARGRTNAIILTAHPHGSQSEGQVNEKASVFRSAELPIDSAADTAVEWQSLIRALHEVETEYWPDQCSCSMRANPPLNVHRRTSAAVAYKLQSWDFIPPDVVRPLALTTVGDIVILAIRMGMTWRELRPGKGQIQADGGGYNITSTNIRGVGTVLRFGEDIEDLPRTPYIPSTYSDMMLCGILPVDTELVDVEKGHFKLFDGKQNTPDLTPLLT